MVIHRVEENKKRHLDLLLIGDEQENMIDVYLEHGDMYVLEDGGAAAVCVVTDEGGGLLELKNIAVREDCRRRGHARAMIDFIAGEYKHSHNYLQAGTGETPSMLAFYEGCGFVPSHRIENFFTDN